MRTPPLLADFIHHRVCKPICEKYLTLPISIRQFFDCDLFDDLEQEIK